MSYLFSALLANFLVFSSPFALARTYDLTDSGLDSVIHFGQLGQEISVLAAKEQLLNETKDKTLRTFKDKGIAPSQVKWQSQGHGRGFLISKSTVCRIEVSGYADLKANTTCLDR